MSEGFNPSTGTVGAALALGALLALEVGEAQFCDTEDFGLEAAPHIFSIILYSAVDM